MQFLEKFMQVIRETSEFGSVLLQSLARGWGLLSTVSLILVTIIHISLSQKFTILETRMSSLLHKKLDK